MNLSTATRMLPALLILIALSLPTPSSADDLLTRVVCGKDLNSDGVFDGEGEIVACENGVCPHDTVECVKKTTPPLCPGGGTLDAVRDKCDITPSSIGCPPDYTFDAAQGVCKKPPACAAPGVFNAAADKCVTESLGATCPTGTLYNATRARCEAAPSCASGTTYNASINKCESGAVPIGYGTHWAWDSDSNQYCSKDPAITANPVEECAYSSWWGGWSINREIIGYVAATPGANLIPIGYGTHWAWDSDSNQYCSKDSKITANPVEECAYSSWWGGWSINREIVGYVAALPAANLIPIGYGTHWAWDSDSNQYCSKDSAITANPVEECAYSSWWGGWSINREIIGYVAALPGTAEPTCPSGTTFDGVSDICWAEHTISCPANMTYDPASGMCVAAPTCTAGGTFNPSLDTCLLDPAHNCPDGYSWTGLPLSVCEANPVCTDGTYNPDLDICSGDGVTCPLGNYACADTDGSGVKRCSDLPCINLGNSTNLEDEASDMTSYQDDGVIDPNTGACSGGFKIFNGRGGECLRPGLKTMFFNCCDTSVGSFLFIKEYCPEDNATTVQAVVAKTTHYVGDYCKKKIKFIGCIQKAAMYCIFNSKLARIIHEQGRFQLQKFGSSGGWGAAEGPNCEGFTPEEFQMLDFSRIDLAEFMGDINTKALDQVQQGVQDAVSNFQQNIR